MGKATVEALAKHHPAHLYFTGRNNAAADSIIKQLKTSIPGLSISFLLMDLSYLASVKSAAAKITHDRLDILICNGGILVMPAAVSVDGFETHMAVNHLAHAMLIRELRPLLLRTAEQPGADVRLIILSSAGFINHPKDGIAWDKIRTKQSGPIESLTRYG
jgi:NAD(P)-dependent dehydrogenase (short-subunit alcohol dehydrogenase family)